MSIASSPEHLHMMEKMSQELGKEERCSAVLAMADRERGGASVRFGRGRVGNVAHLGLGWLSENIAEVCEVLVELWLEWCWLWCSGELTRARRSKAAGNGVGAVLLRLRRRRKEARK